MSKNVYGLSLLVAWGAMGCAVDAGEGTETTAERNDELYVDSGEIWDSLFIPVCFENLSNNVAASVKTLIKDAVTNTWQAQSHVRFTGWGTCPTDNLLGNPRGIRVWANTLVATEDDASHAVCLGECVSGDKAGIELRTGGLPNTEIQRVAVHEFGHALGFAHEQNRPDAPMCRFGTQGHDGDTLATAYDPDSVMNYCDASRGPSLSAKDIEGLRKYYWGLQVSRDGTSGWDGTPFVASDLDIGSLRGADFNGNGLTDLFRADGTGWYISWEGKTGWERVNSSAYEVDALKFGHFDNDRNTDVFLATGSAWYVSAGGKGPWVKLNTSSVTSVALGDFDGDTRSDVFQATGSEWKVSWSGTSGWQRLNTSNITLSSLRFADFNGDGKTDVFASTGGQWKVSLSGTSGWQVLNHSDKSLSDLKIGDFTGDGKADVFYADDERYWYISESGTGGWTVLNQSALGTSDVLFGNFDGDAKTDVLRARHAF